MCFVLGFSPSWKVPVRSGGAKPTAHSCGPPHEKSQLPGDYRAPGAWGGGRSTRSMGLSSLPCLTPPFMSASLATLFSSAAFALFALGLFSLPSPQPFPLHLAVLAASAPLLSPPQDPALSSPDPQPPAPTSPALASCPYTSSAPPSSPSPAQNLPLPWAEGEEWHKVPPGVLHPCPESFSPFLPSVLLSPPGCFQDHSPPRVCPALSQPGILLPPPSASWKQ